MWIVLLRHFSQPRNVGETDISSGSFCLKRNRSVVLLERVKQNVLRVASLYSEHPINKETIFKRY